MSSIGSIPLRTGDEIRREFALRGIAVSEWALANHVSAPLTYQVLAGKKRCLRGQSHDIAVLLGMKAGHVRSSMPLTWVFQHQESPPQT
jgi:gp16 family phage-associated protein